MFDNNIIVAVDPGKYLTKAITDNDRCYFRTKYTKIDTFEDVLLQGKSYKVEFEGKKMIIGEQGNRTSYEVSKKSMIHKVATYTAIVEMLKYDLEYSNINAMISCPISIYKDEDQRKAYKEYMLNNNEVKININENDYLINLKNVMVLPESSGVIIKHASLFNNNMVALVDIGGLNMNFSIYDNMVFQMGEKNSFTRNLGNNELETYAINALNSKLAININNEEGKYIIKNGGIKHQGEITEKSKEIVDEVKDNFVERIDNEIKKNNFDLQKMNVVFTGGTSLNIQKELQKKYTHSTVLEDGQWAHVEGAYKLGREVINGEE
ncbi:MAG: hypothetical protein ACOCUI_00300 [bacterium]